MSHRLSLVILLSIAALLALMSVGVSAQSVENPKPTGSISGKVTLNDKPAADIGRSNLAIVTLEQAYPKLFLKFADLDAECRLADMAGRRRPTEMPVIRPGNQVSQFGQCHFRP